MNKCKDCIKFEVFNWCKDTMKSGTCEHRSYSNGQPIVSGEGSCPYFSPNDNKEEMTNES